MNFQKRVEDFLGIKVKKINFFETAFIHKSFANENRKIEDNERLEFLGDAVLELATTNFLFHKFPKKPEGYLTKLRSALVSGKNLAKISRELKLGNIIKLSRGEIASGGQKKSPILANVFEALIGAIYLYSGFLAAEKFLQQNLFITLDAILRQNLQTDSKSEFQELSQDIFSQTPQYELISESGPDHAKIFSIVALVSGKKMGIGSGSSKQKAETAAAKNALENLKKQKK